MNTHDVSTLAASFHALHRGPSLLLVANAWDAGSARLLESLGARAIATSSAAVSWMHGYPDGDALPASAAVSTAAEITRVVRVPVSIDFEGGYSDNPETVAAHVRSLIDVGVVGINLEDGIGSTDSFCRKIDAIRRMASAVGVRLFVNARTDVYLRQLVAPADRVTETCARARRYLDAGASGLFVPGIVKPEEIAKIAHDVALPLNVMTVDGLAAPTVLAELGVRRLSAGSSIAEAMWGRVRALATQFLREGSVVPSAEGVMGYGELNALFSRG